jgi:hypothetical protein
MSGKRTNRDAEPSPASAGCHGDTLSVLRTLIDGVRGMGLGDPDCGDRIEASDVVRWAVDEIERLRDAIERLRVNLRLVDAGFTFGQPTSGQPTLTDAEREAIQRAIDSQQHRAAEMHSRSWNAAAIDEDCDTLRGMLERTK